MFPLNIMDITFRIWVRMSALIHSIKGIKSFSTVVHIPY